MGVNVEAIFDRPDDYGTPEALTSRLNDKLNQFDSRQATWVLSADKDYIDNETGPCSISLGNKALSVSFSVRWVMFCNNTKNAQSETLHLLYEVGAILAASQFLLVPDSSFDESRCIDLLEEECSLEEFEKYLRKIGSCRKTPNEITFIKNGCWYSHGYMHFAVGV